jgi:hypothetical protein
MVTSSGWQVTTIDGSHNTEMAQAPDRRQIIQESAIRDENLQSFLILIGRFVTLKR